jgi:hypothetical protein
MIARVQALTGLEFNVEAVGSAARPNVGGSIVDSTAGWPIDHVFPHYRKVLPANALHYGYLLNTPDPTKERINERVHWSVVAKRQDHTAQPYHPPNLPSDIPPHKIVEITKEEQALLQACGVGRPEHS